MKEPYFTDAPRIKDIPLFIQLALSFFSLERGDCTTL